MASVISHTLEATMEAKSDQFEASGERKNNQAATVTELPSYDKASGTRKLLLVALLVSVLFSLTGIGIALHFLVVAFECSSDKSFPDELFGGPMQQIRYCFNGRDLFPVGPGTSKILTLLFNIVVTVCTEVLGYIHSVSLRWALAAEGRLDFNSNLRLFSRARKSIGHGIVANIFFFFCLTLCYAGASRAVFEETDGIIINTGELYEPIYTPSFALQFSPIGIAGASSGLLGLSLLTGVAWLAGERSNRIKSWNAHPLNTALASRHHNLVSRKSGRATLNSSQRRMTTGKAHILPSRQPSALQTVPAIKHISRFAISITCMTLGLACIALIIVLRIQWTWEFFPDTQIGGDSVIGTNSITINPDHIPSIALVILLPLLWTFCWQSISTLSFHIFELAANIRRDESLWRRAASANNGKGNKGANIDQNVVSVILNSKSSIALLCLKPFSQWLVNLGLWISPDDVAGINPFPLLVLVIPLGLMALITVMAARYRPKGPLPSTYGHVQTIVDLVDDWGEGAKGKLWWGDKGSFSDSTGMTTLRLVGTSGQEKGVGEIHLSEVYSNF